MQRIELRSDTFTKPTSEMLKAMMSAEVGDDVFREDPTVNKLEELAKEMFGMSGALFCPSGTMTNQIALNLNSGPLSEIIIEENSHVYQYEVGGIAFNSRASMKLVRGTQGKLTPKDIEKNINPDDVHKPETTLVSLENTTNRGGGAYYTVSELNEIKTICNKYNLKLHLDGARLFNALVETNDSPKEYGKIFDTISICLSKGLGAPIGSILLTNNDRDSKRARKLRKVFGGGMRQAGFIAAAGIYALENNIERLKIDHKNAKRMANALESKSFVEQILPVSTNILIFKVKDDIGADTIVEKLKNQDIDCIHIGENKIRFVTHLGVSESQVDQVINSIENL